MLMVVPNTMTRVVASHWNFPKNSSYATLLPSTYLSFLMYRPPMHQPRPIKPVINLMKTSLTFPPSPSQINWKLLKSRAPTTRASRFTVRVSISHSGPQSHARPLHVSNVPDLHCAL